MSLLKNSNSSYCGGGERTDFVAPPFDLPGPPRVSFPQGDVHFAKCGQIAADMLSRRASSLHSPRSQTELTQFFNRLLKRLRALLQNLEVGARRPLLVRLESVPRIGVGKRVLFASDLHLRKDGPRHIVDGLVEIASRHCPDLVLLGGDLVDSSRGMEALQSLVRRFARVAPVGAVGGNHDRWIGVSRVRNAVLAGGGRWLEDAPWLLTPDCAVYGSDAQPAQPARHHLLCAHHPAANELNHLAGGRFDLTLSGHLHGGQFVFFERHGRFYPGAFLYRWNGLRFEDKDGKTLLISRGVQDTLPLRWNCPREVLIVDI